MENISRFDVYWGMRASDLGANGGSDKSIFCRVDTDAKKLLDMLLLSSSDWRTMPFCLPLRTWLEWL